MSPILQKEFVANVIPIITAAVARTVAPIGAEDTEELIQDALAMACAAVERLEQRQKPVPMRSIAHYALQRLKSGRRSYSAGRTDVMSPACQLDGRSSVSSTEEALEGSDMCLGETLAARKDDPSLQATRSMDWQEMMSLFDSAQQYIIQATAHGYPFKDQATQLGISQPAVSQRLKTITKQIKAYWGADVLRDVSRQPLWRRSLH